MLDYKVHAFNLHTKISGENLSYDFPRRFNYEFQGHELTVIHNPIRKDSVQVTIYNPEQYDRWSVKRMRHSNLKFCEFRTDRIMIIHCDPRFFNEERHYCAAQWVCEAAILKLIADIIGVILPYDEAMRLTADSTAIADYAWYKTVYGLTFMERQSKKYVDLLYTQKKSELNKDFPEACPETRFANNIPMVIRNNFSYPTSILVDHYINGQLGKLADGKHKWAYTAFINSLKPQDFDGAILNAYHGLESKNSSYVDFLRLYLKEITEKLIKYAKRVEAEAARKSKHNDQQTSEE